MSFSGVCGHGKRLYPTRKLARQVARRAHGHHLREYRCTDVEGYWHIGHLAHDVMRGNLTAGEIFNRANSDQQVADDDDDPTEAHEGDDE